MLKKENAKVILLFKEKRKSELFKQLLQEEKKCKNELDFFEIDFLNKGCEIVTTLCTYIILFLFLLFLMSPAIVLFFSMKSSGLGNP